MRRYWYAYISGDDLDPNRYQIIDIKPQNFCFGGEEICAIYSPPDINNQNIPAQLSNNIKAYAITAKGLAGEYPIFPKKPYVYTSPCC